MTTKEQRATSEGVGRSSVSQFLSRFGSASCFFCWKSEQRVRLSLIRKLQAGLPLAESRARLENSILHIVEC